MAVLFAILRYAFFDKALIVFITDWKQVCPWKSINAHLQEEVLTENTLQTVNPC